VLSGFIEVHKNSFYILDFSTRLATLNQTAVTQADQDVKSVEENERKDLRVAKPRYD
jgi:hypothetical protein